jgi:hypothetical protein
LFVCKLLQEVTHLWPQHLQGSAIWHSNKSCHQAVWSSCAVINIHKAMLASSKCHCMFCCPSWTASGDCHHICHSHSHVIVVTAVLPGRQLLSWWLFHRLQHAQALLESLLCPRQLADQHQQVPPGFNMMQVLLQYLCLSLGSPDGGGCDGNQAQQLTDLCPGSLQHKKVKSTVASVHLLPRCTVQHLEKLQGNYSNSQNFQPPYSQRVSAACCH